MREEEDRRRRLHLHLDRRCKNLWGLFMTCKKICDDIFRGNRDAK